MREKCFVSFVYFGGPLGDVELVLYSLERLRSGVEIALHDWRRSCVRGECSCSCVRSEEVRRL